MGACFSSPSSRVSSPRESEGAEELPALRSNSSKPSSARRNLSKSQYSTGTSTTEGTMSATSMGSSIGRSSIGSENSEELAFPNGRILSFPNLKIFTFADLKSATKGFKPESFLGQGGFGSVYKGWLNEKTFGPSRWGHGKVVAVKKLNAESMQGWQEWQSEVNFLGRLLHPNLVKLIGYCWEEKELLLVYEFMTKGSLENHLFRRGAVSQVLSWSQRLKIASDAARGLAFLHTSDRKIIYRDFKASNILLDSDYNAKIADFGLAKEGPETGESHVSTRVMGTYGYVAPEYATTGHLYVKSDVYGFGVVLLELLTGQRALDMNRPSGKQNLVTWAKPLLTDRKKFTHIMDPQLDEQYSSKAAFETCQLANRCMALELRNRPSMNDVVETLERIEAMKIESKAVKMKPPRPGARNLPRTPPHHRSPYHPRYDSTNMELAVA